MGAVHLHLGGAPEGPAGTGQYQRHTFEATNAQYMHVFSHAHHHSGIVFRLSLSLSLYFYLSGKTETVKDLSKAIAIQAIVFNCS